MKFLIVEDDFTARKLLQMYLSDYGRCFTAVNGSEAIQAFRDALDEDDPYDLICLDIMMPEIDGLEVLKTIRKLEQQHGINQLDRVKIIMITARDDSKDVMDSFRDGCEAYIVKPVKKEKFLLEIKKLGLIKLNAAGR
jgi:two-component system chemotaxis response regulator CheY